MTADIINLRRARKDKARSEKERQAAENRTRFGRSRAEKARVADEEAMATRKLDGHRLSDTDQTPSAGPKPDDPTR